MIASVNGDSHGTTIERQIKDGEPKLNSVGNIIRNGLAFDRSADRGINPDPGKVLLFLAVLALAPLLGFQFGSGNQVEQFALIARMIDPNFAAGDFYIDAAAGFGPRYYYSKFMAVIVGLTSYPFAILVFSLLTNFATGAVTFYAASKLLRASVIASAAAAILAVANSSFALGLAGYVRFDSFQPASMAIPISLAGLVFLFQGRAFLAAFLFGLGGLFHPLIGVETGLVSFGAYFLATIFRQKFNPALFRELIRQVGAGILFIALIFISWGIPSMMIGGEKIPDAEFFDILISFRAPHHYLAGVFPVDHYVTLAFFTASIAALMGIYGRHLGLSSSVLGLIIAAIAVLVVCAFSYLFVDMLQSRLYATAQVFRMLFLVKWIGFLFIGWAVGYWFERHGLVGLIIGFLAILVAGEAHGRALALMVFLGSIAGFGFFAQNEIRKWLLALLAVIGAAYFHNDLGYATGTVRALFALGILFLLFLLPLNKRGAMALSGVAAIVLVAFVLGNRAERWIDKEAFRSEFAWSDLKGPDMEIARWANANTPDGAIWATPPTFESFRIVAERAIIVDYTSVPFGDLAQREWRDRIETLYGPANGGGFNALNNMVNNFKTADERTLKAAMERYGADYAVLYAETPWQGDVLFQNETFKAVKRE